MNNQSYILGALIENPFSDIRHSLLYYTGRDFRKANSDNEKVTSFKNLEDAQKEAALFMSKKEPVVLFIFKEELVVNGYSKATDIIDIYKVS